MTSSPPTKSGISTFHLYERILQMGMTVQDILNIPLNALIENRIQFPGFYRDCKMLFNEFVVSYHSKVMFKNLTPIEQLSKEEKMHYWNQTEGITEDKDERIRIVKVMYVIDYLITQKHLKDVQQ